MRYFKAVLNCDCSVIGWRNKTKTTVAWLHAFSLTLLWLHETALNPALIDS